MTKLFQVFYDKNISRFQELYLNLLYTENLCIRKHWIDQGSNATIKRCQVILTRWHRLINPFPVVNTYTVIVAGDLRALGHAVLSLLCYHSNSVFLPPLLP